MKVLITGTSRGIGKAIAELFLQCGVPGSNRWKIPCQTGAFSNAGQPLVLAVCPVGPALYRAALAEFRCGWTRFDRGVRQQVRKYFREPWLVILEFDIQKNGRRKNPAVRKITVFQQNSNTPKSCGRWKLSSRTGFQLIQ